MGQGLGFPAAMITYGGVVTLLSGGWRGRWVGALLIAATAATALWAGVETLARWPVAVPMAVIGLAEVTRTGCWIALLLATLARASSDAVIGSWRLEWWLNGRGGVVAIGTVLFVLAAVDAMLGAAMPRHSTLQPALSLCLTVVGLSLIETLFAATNGENRWAFKHLLIGLGALFGFDLVFYSDALLFHRFDPALAAARPLVAILAVPFLLVAAARIRAMAFNISVSRSAVLHTGTLIVSGLYLLGVSGTGYLLRETGLPMGAALAAVLLAAALMGLAALLASRGLRARVKTFIALNFFSFVYDYRHEWRRFIGRMSDHAGTESLSQRAIGAMADLMECSSGALFLRDDDDRLILADRLNWQSIAGLTALPDPAVADLERERQVLDLREAAGDGADRRALFPVEEPWLLCPLTSHGRLFGAILLGQPRVPRPLTWEDHDILEILGVQVASYLAEERAARALVEAQRFEHLSRNFSFVAHDLKNLISQLSLIVQQAGRHGRNPEFQRDALITIGNSVEKMRAMLVRLAETGAAGPSGAGEIIDLQATAGAILEQKRPMLGGLVTGWHDDPVAARFDRAALAAVLDNIVQNALDAAGERCRLVVTCRPEAGRAVLELSDNGPGMTPELLACLFRPFTSTKGGYGIGLYQCREITRRFGGTIEVVSAPGRGTTVRLSLPRVPAVAAPKPTIREAASLEASMAHQTEREPWLDPC